jgi:Leucine-rich repeat (LRR) protein
MGEISIQYEDTSARNQEWIVSVNIRKIDMRSKNIASVDLSELKECAELEELNLSWNSIKRVDLAPLSSCRILQALDLNQNNLIHIDLTPLRECWDL